MQVLVIDAGPAPRPTLTVDTRLNRAEPSVGRLVEDAPSPIAPAGPAPVGSLMPRGGCWLPALLGVLLLAGVLLCASRFYNWSAQEKIVLLIIVLLLLGRKLPEVGRYLGKGIVEFRKGVKGLEELVKRRATVRYYSRMNPERVYPLLVLITRGQVARVHKRHTDQRTSAPFAVDLDAPVEIEPVLPGCDCYPPRVVTRLGQGDLALTFRVVPHVLGQVDGAVVSIRQDHACLAEVALDVKVAKRTLVALSGAAAFLLPGLSAALKHFGLDFETQKEQGFSLYLAVAQLVFDRVSPLALTGLLGVATALLWWLTRPRMRDVFWDGEKLGADEGRERVTGAAFQRQ
jgi:TatA/E family protein of Tat protein translocase